MNGCVGNEVLKTLEFSYNESSMGYKSKGSIIIEVNEIELVTTNPMDRHRRHRDDISLSPEGTRHQAASKCDYETASSAS